MEYPNCPKCNKENVYIFEENYICPDCFYEWSTTKPVEENSLDILVVKDSNGTILNNGDSIIIVKTLPVKGSFHPIKIGTKVKNIRLTEGDHNIDCKIDGFGAMALKSEFVKKV